MSAIHWLGLGFIGGIAVMGVIFERKYRRLEKEIREHLSTEDRLRRYGA